MVKINGLSETAFTSFSMIFEASFMKKPIINGVSGFAAQYVETMEAGINIEPENHRDLIEAILFLQDNPNASKQFGLSGHKYVTKHNNRQELSLKYVSILEKVSKYG